jgi:hypothetical protein
VDSGLPTGPFPYNPRNFDPLPHVANATANEVMVDCDVTFDTTNLTWSGCTENAFVTLVTLSDGTEAALAVLSSLQINSGQDIDIEGDRAGIIAVYGDATIDGNIFATPNNGVDGPGELPPDCASTGNGADGSEFNGSGGGGGGGGFGSVGEQAGDGRTGSGAAGGSGGAVNGDNAFSPLRRGCRGGRGARNNTNSGGEAGGALQLSVAGTLSITGGRISSSGDGGRRGEGSEGGGGGGSGGMVLIEADVLSFSGGWVTANGGSGGEGGSSSSEGADGEDGSTNSANPAVTADDRTTGGNGGNGAAGSTQATAGANGGGSDVAGGGGGGGGVGRIGVSGHSSCDWNAAGFSPDPIDVGSATCN